jgi:hypothetical protein
MPTRLGKKAEKKKVENRKDREVKVKLLYDRLRFHYGLNLTASNKKYFTTSLGRQNL